VSRVPVARLLALAALGGGLAACNDNSQLAASRAWRPISSETMALMQNKGVDSHAPILIRTFKKEAEFEIWKMKPDGHYTHLRTFPMCRWSGQLGPKVREGDRQVPEGFYTITPGQMNPNSAYYLSFNVGYPNALDRTLGHSGGSIMVHGACSSAGCFSMTDAQIADIYAIAREAFGGGQRQIQMESFPFHMTAENMAKHRLDPNIAFWKNLKEGSDHFEVTKSEPIVGACGRKYVFNATAPGGMDPGLPCPAGLKQNAEIREMVAEKQARDEVEVADLIAKGVKPVRVVYADGGQNAEFASRLADVSRPDALAAGPTEIVLDEPKSKSPVVRFASAKALKGKIDTAAADKAESTVARTDPTPTSTAFAAAAPAPAPSALSNWFGLKKDEPKPAVDVAEPADPQPAQVPLPPRRASVAGKPQASLDPKDTGVFYGARKTADNQKGADFIALEPVRH
jgi:murein L,D-transpeptidase YafK